MPWRSKPIKPFFMPVGKNGKTFDPGLVVETQRLPAGDLGTCDIWLSARLTRIGRERLPVAIDVAWHVRRVGDQKPCALLIQLRTNLAGRVIAVALDRVAMKGFGRFLIFVPGRVVAVQQWDPMWAWHTVADLLEGTLPPKRSRNRGLPDADIDALSALTA